MVKKRKVVKKEASPVAKQSVKAVQPARVSVQPKPAAQPVPVQPAPVKVQKPESKDVLSSKDREILSEVDRVIWNPSLLNKFKETKTQLPDGHDKKKLAK